MAILQLGFKVPFTVKFTDNTGNAARVDGVPVCSSTDDTKATVANVAADGLSGEVVSVGVGTCQISVKADADLGEGLRELTVLGDVEVLAGEAVAGSIEFGAPVPA